MITEMPRNGRQPLRSVASPVHLPDTPPAAPRLGPPALGAGAAEALADYGIWHPSASSAAEHRLRERPGMSIDPTPHGAPT